MNNNESIELLRKTYENAKTGMDAIGLLMSKIQTTGFGNLLSEQKAKYYEIAREAALQLGGYQELPPEGGVFSRLGMWSSVQMNIVNSKRTDRMAEVMINGSTEGMIEMRRLINRFRNADPRTLALANRLVDAEQENITLMQHYL